MEKDLILERLLATEEYKAFKKNAKNSIKILIPTIIVFVFLSYLVASKALFSIGSIVTYFFTVLFCIGLKDNIKIFSQEKPLHYGVSVIKEKKETRSHKVYRPHYLITINGNDIWARDFRGYKNSSGNRFDYSKLQVGHSVIVFKETPKSLYYIVSNE